MSCWRYVAKETAIAARVIEITFPQTTAKQRRDALDAGAIAGSTNDRRS